MIINVCTHILLLYQNNSLGKSQGGRVHGHQINLVKHFLKHTFVQEGTIEGWQGLDIYN